MMLRGGIKTGYIFAFAGWFLFGRSTQMLALFSVFALISLGYLICTRYRTQSPTNPTPLSIRFIRKTQTACAATGSRECSFTMCAACSSAELVVDRGATPRVARTSTGTTAARATSKPPIGCATKPEKLLALSSVSLVEKKQALAWESVHLKASSRNDFP